MFDSFLFIALLILSVLGLSILALLLGMKDHRRRSLLLGIQVLQAGRVLLTHLQQHRGQSVARQSGISASLHQLDLLRHQIVLDMRQMSNFDHWLSEHEDWQGITRHWASLSAQGRELRAEDSFNQHSRLISALLTLLAEITRHYGLETNPRHANTWLIWHQYLQVGELVGQCRALGVQVFTTTYRDEKHRQMNLLAHNLDALDETLVSALFAQKLSDREIARLSGFITYLRGQLAMSEPDLSIMEYYQQATEIIDMVFEHFDIEMRKLHRQFSS